MTEDYPEFLPYTPPEISPEFTLGSISWISRGFSLWILSGIAPEIQAIILPGNPLRNPPVIPQDIPPIFFAGQPRVSPEIFARKSKIQYFL